MCAFSQTRSVNSRTTKKPSDLLEAQSETDSDVHRRLSTYQLLHVGSCGETSPRSLLCVFSTSSLCASVSCARVYARSMAAEAKNKRSDFIVRRPFLSSNVRPTIARPSRRQEQPTPVQKALREPELASTKLKLFARCSAEFLKTTRVVVPGTSKNSVAIRGLTLLPPPLWARNPVHVHRRRSTPSDDRAKAGPASIIGDDGPGGAVISGVLERKRAASGYTSLSSRNRK